MRGLRFLLLLLPPSGAVCREMVGRGRGEGLGEAARLETAVQGGLGTGSSLGGPGAAQEWG